MPPILNDLRFSARMLWKKPGLVLISVLALALGISANTVIFSFVHALLLKPFAFPEPERIVALWDESERSPHNEVSIANYLDWRAQSQSFEHLALYRWTGVNLTGTETPERVQGAMVTANLLDALGMPPAQGRNFRAEENEPGKENVAILSHRFWQRSFGGDPGIVGKTIQLNGVPRAVIGVMPPAFNYPRGVDVMLPLAFTPEVRSNRGAHAFLSVGRLKAGVSKQQAQAEMTSIAARLAQQYPEQNAGLGIGVYPLVSDTARPYRGALLALLCAVVFVLLIACANVANLLLARAAERSREMAIRAAVGAGRLVLIRQMLVESLLLALTGGIVGVLLALWGVAAVKASLPAEAFDFVAGLRNLEVNYTVLGFTLGLSLLTGIIFGLAPALQFSRPDLNEFLKEGSKGSAGPGGNRLRSALVTAEVALSLILLTGAGFMMRSFLHLLRINPGFDGEKVITLGLQLPQAKYTQPAQRILFYQELDRRLHSMPGLEAAGFVSHLPLGGSNASSNFLIEGQPEPPPNQRFSGRFRVCTPDYFNAMGIVVRQGRAFRESDTAETLPVVVVNETLARRFFPKGDAIGKRFRFTGELSATNPWREIVGVIADVAHDLSTPMQPEYYLPHTQFPRSEMMLAARAQSDPAALTGAIRAEIQALDRDQPVFQVMTMTQVRQQSVLLQEMSFRLLGIFAVVALLLAAIGMYGVMSYHVNQRAREIGIRMALGAQRSDIGRLIVRQGMTLTAVGVFLGLIASIALASLASSLLVGVRVTDWLTFAAVTSLLALVALLSCWLPARRATRVDPMMALRQS